MALIESEYESVMDGSGNKMVDLFYTWDNAHPQGATSDTGFVKSGRGWNIFPDHQVWLNVKNNVSGQTLAINIPPNTPAPGISGNLPQAWGNIGAQDLTLGMTVQWIAGG